MNECMNENSSTLKLCIHVSQDWDNDNLFTSQMGKVVIKIVDNFTLHAK